MSKAKKNTGGKPELEDITDALVLADSFDTRFTPISAELPRALMPLVNTPMLNYTVEFLASSGITHIYVFCCAHATMIEQHVANTFRFMPNVKVECIKAKDCTTAGEALRIVYESHLLQSDFVLVSGDVVSNIDLKPILARHQEKRKKDKLMIMTTLLMQASPHHRSRAQEDATIVAVDPSTSELLHYDNNTNTKKVAIKAELFRTHPTLSVRYDLLDCRVDICSPEVLYMLNDDFDYEDLRTDWMMGVLNNEIIENRIMTEIINDGYANRCRNLSTYVALSNDIVHRWTYPMVPDNNWLNDTTYTQTRPLIYKEEDVKLARSCLIRKDSVIASGVSVGKQSAIHSSVIGRNCEIGNKVTIVNSYLWDGVVVEDCSTITNAIVCSNAVILRNTHISKGCVVSFGVRVGPDFTAEAETKLTLLRVAPDEYGEESYTEKVDTGAEGNGHRWVSPDDDPLHKLFPPRRLAEEDDDVESDESDGETELLTAFEKFCNQVTEVMAEAIANDLKDLDSVVFEIGTARMKYDRTTVECATTILPQICNLVADGSPKTLKELKLGVKKIFPKWMKLVAKFLPDRDREAQVELLFSLQELCEKEEDEEHGISAVFQDVLFLLYNMEVIEEDAVFDWADEQAEGSAEEKRFVKKCDKFITWLKEAEEDDDDDSD